VRLDDVPMPAFVRRSAADLTVAAADVTLAQPPKVIAGVADSSMQVGALAHAFMMPAVAMDSAAKKSVAAPSGPSTADGKSGPLAGLLSGPSHILPSMGSVFGEYMTSMIPRKGGNVSASDVANATAQLALQNQRARSSSSAR